MCGSLRILEVYVFDDGFEFFNLYGESVRFFWIFVVKLSGIIGNLLKEVECDVLVNLNVFYGCICLIIKLVVLICSLVLLNFFIDI